MQLGLSFKERRGGGGHLRASEISGIIPTYARQTQNKTAGRQTHNVGSNAKVSPDSPGAINPSQKSPTGLCDLSRCCARACTPRPYTQTPYTVCFFSFSFLLSFFLSSLQSRKRCGVVWYKVMTVSWGPVYRRALAVRVRLSLTNHSFRQAAINSVASTSSARFNPAKQQLIIGLRVDSFTRCNGSRFKRQRNTSAGDNETQSQMMTTWKVRFPSSSAVNQKEIKTKDEKNFYFSACCSFNGTNLDLA